MIQHQQGRKCSAAIHLNLPAHGLSNVVGVSPPPLLFNSTSITDCSAAAARSLESNSSLTRLRLRFRVSRYRCFPRVRVIAHVYSDTEIQEEGVRDLALSLLRSTSVTSLNFESSTRSLYKLCANNYPSQVRIRMGVHATQFSSCT